VEVLASTGEELKAADSNVVPDLDPFLAQMKSRGTQNGVIWARAAYSIRHN